jgi:hypothetical protein
VSGLLTSQGLSAYTGYQIIIVATAGETSYDALLNNRYRESPTRGT